MRTFTVIWIAGVALTQMFCYVPFYIVVLTLALALALGYCTTKFSKK